MKFAIFLTVDDRFRTLGYAQAVHLARTQSIDVHLFDEGKSPYPALPEVEGLTIHKGRLGPLVDTQLPSSRKWPHVVYGRLFVPQILSSYSRLLYVDADVAVVGDLLPLLSGPMDGAAIGAVHDADVWGSGSPIAGCETKDEWLRGIGVQDTRYFNSGVLLIEVERYLQVDVSAPLAGYFQTYGDMVTMWDQDFLNYLFQSRWKELSPVWNFQAICNDSGYGSFMRPAIFHFNEVQKPWHKGYYFGDPRFFEYFLRLAEMAGVDIKSFPPFVHASMTRRVKYAVRSFLYRLGLRWRFPRRRVKESLERRAAMIDHLNDVVSDGRYPVDLDTLQKMKKAKMTLGFNGNEVWNRVEGTERS